MEAGRMVGRDAELARLVALLDDAAAGQAVCALISGDAGVGKTRLTGEVVKIAGREGFTVLSGHCAEIGDSVPYLPLADALRGTEAAARVREAVAKRPVLGWLLPEAGLAEPQRDPAGLARQQMFGAVLGLLSELAGERPVLLVLEDIHWADGSTRALLTFLSRVLHRERIAVICTYRTDDLHRRHPLRSVVAELQRLPGVTSVELGPLQPAALAEHLSAIPNAPGLLDAASLNSLVERAEGNAYYAEELLAAAARVPAARSPAAKGSIGERTELPSGLAALLLARVERVSDSAQQVLRAASVAGRRADDELVRAASGLPGAEYDHAIREAVAHQLLVPDGASGYAFRHALLREAVYGDLLPGERTRLHAAMADLLDDSQRLALPGTAAELAHHRLASHDIPGAFRASVRAGQEAERMAAPAEAHRHFDQALALWDRVTDAEALAEIPRIKLGLMSAAAAAASGDVPRAVHQLRRIWELIGSAGSQGPETEPTWRCRIGERLAYYLLQLDLSDAFAEALAIAPEAVAALPAEPPTWHRARAMATYANALLISNDEALAEQWAQRARQAATAADAPWVEADSLVTLGLLAARDGAVEEASKLFTAAHEQARQAGVLGVELRASFQLASAHLSRGDLAEAAEVAHFGVSRAEESGLLLAPYGRDLQHLHFQAHFAEGIWDHAQLLADGFVVRVTSQPEAVLSAMALFIDVARGNPAAEERRIWLEPYWHCDEFTAYIGRGLLAEQALWRGDTDLALAEAEAARATDISSPSTIRVAAVALAARADRARHAHAVGDAETERAEIAEAQRLLTLAREGAAFAFRPKFVLGPEGRGWLARAEAEYLRAIGENSPSAWQAVLDAFGPGYAYEIARTRWRLAEALVEAGSRADAASQWNLAASAAARLGAAPLRAALDDLARRARLDGTTISQPAARGAFASARGASADGLAALTDRERDVLKLLATGRSNREIGDALFIAPKTASVHVSNILAKLHVSSRTEAAALAHREGLTS